MPADTPLGNEGSLNGTTAVAILAAPGAGLQRVVPERGAGVHNADTVSHTITWQKNKASTITVLQVDTSVAAGAVVRLNKKVVLDATDESLEAVSDAGATTTEPTFDVAALQTS